VAEYDIAGIIRASPSFPELRVPKKSAFHDQNGVVTRFGKNWPRTAEEKEVGIKAS
jgi:hypothetical protein